MGRKRILVVVVLVAVVAVLAFAWIDGGREEPRLIEREIDLPEYTG